MLVILALESYRGHVLPGDKHVRKSPTGRGIKTAQFRKVELGSFFIKSGAQGMAKRSCVSRVLLL